MQRDDLIAIYLTLERTQQRPIGIEYNGAERSFFWRFPSIAKSAVDVSLDEPGDVMRAIAQLDAYLASRDLPAMMLSTVGLPP